MRRWMFALSMLMIAGAWFVSEPGAQSARAVEVSIAHFNANRAAYGLVDPASELKLRGNRRDAQGASHVRFDQVYRGLPVFEGEAIAHVDADENVTVTNSLHGNLNVSTNGRIGRGAAIATALRFISPLGDFSVDDASLSILPRGERSLVDRLVWRVVVSVENDFEDPAEWQYFVDANTGTVAFAFDGIETGKPPKGGGGGGGGTTPDTGTGKTMYSGNVVLSIAKSGLSFLLRDLTRGGGNYTCDLLNASGGPCATFSRTTKVFGDNSKSNTDRATAGADAHYGLQATWDYYFNMFGRNGIDGAGRNTFSRVHYGRNYENAFWSDSCFCMTYGDGATTFYPLVSLDVAGHEMSHGVMASEANLTYSGESGGLNESNSDIFGTMVEFAASPSPNYLIGEQIYKPNYSGGVYNPTKALRYMDDPFKDGHSPACWSDTVKNLDVHYSSGPNNHMFYLLAEGGTSKCNGAIVGGIGRDKAARVWYKAIADYMTSSTDYAGARTAALNAAGALYGASSAEQNAVAAAFAAINVN